MHQNPKNVILVKESLSCGTLTLMKTKPFLDSMWKATLVKFSPLGQCHMANTFVGKLSTKGFPCGMCGTSSTFHQARVTKLITQYKLKLGTTIAL